MTRSAENDGPGGHRGRRLLAGALAVTACAIGAAAAPAATVSQDGYGNTTFSAAPGEVNHVAVAYSGSRDRIVFRDALAALTPGGSCAQGSEPGVVECPSQRHDPCEAQTNEGGDQRLRCDQITVRLGDGDDVLLNALFASVHRVAVYGEAGDDQIERLPSPPGTALDTEPLAEWGGEGNDLLIGRDEADDRLVGGPGDDIVVPRLAERSASGDTRPWRTGEDHILGSDAIVPITSPPPGTSPPANGVTHDGVGSVRGGGAFAPSKFSGPGSQAASRATGRERDTLRFSEIRTKHPDLLPGDGVVVYPAVAKSLSIFSGVPRGAAGGDFEIVHGGSGNDEIWGDAADNQLFGNGGNDKLRDGATMSEGKPRASRDRLDGGKGNDTIDSTDPRYSKGKAFYGKDTVVCGAGKDSARIDPADKLSGGSKNRCEKVRRT